MAERCSHTQCGAPATARVAFDALACFVWIDPFEADGPRDVGARGAGALCTRHADRLVPPRGWAVQDRRSTEPTLWSDRPPVDDAVAAARTTRRVHAPAERDRTVVEATLPFEPAAAHGPLTELATGISSDREGGRDEIEALLAAPAGPLLSRAFNPALGGPTHSDPARDTSARGDGRRGGHAG